MLKRYHYLMLIFSSFFLLFAESAFSETVIWTDAEGVVHIVDHISRVPSQYKDKAIRDAELRVSGIEILDYGLFTADVMGSDKNSTTTMGKLSVSNLNTLKLIEKTTIIPAAIGNQFGIKYKVKGKVPGEKKLITIRFLTPGLKSPDRIAGNGSDRSYVEEWSSTKRIGDVTGDFFVFEREWELVSGVWKLQVFDGKKKLSEITFNVIPQKEMVSSRIPPAVRVEIRNILTNDCQKQTEAVKRLAGMGPDAASAIPYLIDAMQDYPLDRQHSGFCFKARQASIALSKIGEPAIEQLITALGRTPMNIRIGAEDTLMLMGAMAHRPLIEALNGHKNWTVRHGAVETLGLMKAKEAISALENRLIGDEQEPIRDAAATALGEIGDKRATSFLIKAYRNDKSHRVRLNALEALVKIEPKDKILRMIPELKEEEESATWKTLWKDEQK